MKTLSWTKDLKDLPNIKDEWISNYMVTKSEKRIKYALEGYVTQIYVSKVDLQYAAKARVMPSQRQGSYNVTVLLGTTEVIDGHCHCPAGSVKIIDFHASMHIK